MSPLAHAGMNSPPRDYGVHETKPTGTFDAMGAIGSIAFAFNTVILPELQVKCCDVIKCSMICSPVRELLNQM